MIAEEVMIMSPLVLHPNTTVSEAIAQAGTADLDILPVVDDAGRYTGAVPKSKLVDASLQTTQMVSELCCDDALVCHPTYAVEHFAHDALSSTPHRSIMVVGQDGQFHGVVPWVHWAVDEAKVQSGHPRSPLEVRTYSMHLTWRCTDCGELMMRNQGIPSECPACGANSQSFCLYTED